MKSIKAFVLRWKMKRVVAALAYRTNTQGRSSQERQRSDVHNFAKALEATEIMTRGMKGDGQLTVSCTRNELTSFIGYVTRLHDSRLSVLLRARIGLATLFMSTKEVLGEDPEEFYERERAEAKVAAGQRVTELVDPSGKNVKVKI